MQLYGRETVFDGKLKERKIIITISSKQEANMIWKKFCSKNLKEIALF